MSESAAQGKAVRHPVALSRQFRPRGFDGTFAGLRRSGGGRGHSRLRCRQADFGRTEVFQRLVSLAHGAVEAPTWLAHGLGSGLSTSRSRKRRRSRAGPVKSRSMAGVSQTILISSGQAAGGHAAHHDDTRRRARQDGLDARAAPKGPSPISIPHPKHSGPPPGPPAPRRPSSEKRRPRRPRPADRRQMASSSWSFPRRLAGKERPDRAIQERSRPGIGTEVG